MGKRTRMRIAILLIAIVALSSAELEQDHEVSMLRAGESASSTLAAYLAKHNDKPGPESDEEMLEILARSAEDETAGLNGEMDAPEDDKAEDKPADDKLPAKSEAAPAPATGKDEDQKKVE